MCPACAHVSSLRAKYSMKQLVERKAIVNLGHTCRVVALQLYYFSTVSVRRSVIQHEQTVRVKRRRHFLGVLFVRAVWLDVLQVSWDI